MPTLPEAVREATEAANEAGRPDVLERIVDGLMEIARTSGPDPEDEDEGVGP